MYISQDITLHICMYMYVATYIMIIHFCYVDSYDSNNNGALIGAVIGVDCEVRVFSRHSKS